MRHKYRQHSCSHRIKLLALLRDRACNLCIASNIGTTSLAKRSSASVAKISMTLANFLSNDERGLVISQ